MVKMSKDRNRCTVVGCIENRSKNNDERKTLCIYHNSLIERKEYQEVCCEKCFEIYDVRKRWPDDVSYSVFQGLCPECQDRFEKSKNTNSNAADKEK